MKRHKIRKPRADAKLKTLHPVAQRELWQFLNKAGNGYAEAVPFVREKFKVDTSEASLSDWFSWYPFSAQLEQYDKLRAELQQVLESNPDLNLDSEQISKASQAVFENLAARTQDAGLFIELRRLRQKDRDQEATDRRLKILEQREEKLKKIVGNEKLTPAERDRKIKDFFGISK